MSLHEAIAASEIADLPDLPALVKDLAIAAFRQDGALWVEIEFNRLFESMAAAR